MFPFHYPYLCGMKWDILTVAWIDCFAMAGTPVELHKKGFVFKMMCSKSSEYNNLRRKLVGIN